jgi:hypothetical protein
MIYRFQRTIFKATTFAVFCVFFLTARHGAAQDYFVGVRGGASFQGGQFYQAEAVVGRNLPWRWNFYSLWFFQPTADVSAGELTDGHTDAFIGQVGVNLELHYNKFPVHLELGFAPTFLSTQHFGPKNFGDDIQFTSHVGVEWDVTDRFTIGCRAHHMSNGRISEPNPGLDIAELTVSFRF